MCSGQLAGWRTYLVDSLHLTGSSCLALIHADGRKASWYGLCSPGPLASTFVQSIGGGVTISWIGLHVLPSAAHSWPSGQEPQFREPPQPLSSRPHALVQVVIGVHTGSGITQRLLL
jgi:hypothetical protein